MPYKGHRNYQSKRRKVTSDGLSMYSGTVLSALQEHFLDAVEFGDIPTVSKILEEDKSFTVDFTDIIGRTPLQLAVTNEHLEVTELLLQRSNINNIHEALLIAISASHEHIAEVILKHPKYLDQKPKNKRIGETDHFFNTTSEDSPFSSNITPLILASERNQFEIVQLLLMRGETIKKPHHYYCSCQECSNKIVFDELRVSKTRLCAYKGLASSSYISLTSKDPIMTAFELARELRAVSRIEKCFKTEYLALADQLSNYVVALVDNVRNHEELELLLNKKKRDPDDPTYELLSRLKLAIYYNEKRFVAHPSCQQKLVSIWYGELRAMERAHFLVRILMVLGITLILPFMAIIYFVAPKSKVGNLIRLPCVKFIGHTMSFMAFLVLILISTMAESGLEIQKLSNFPEIYRRYTWFRNSSLQDYPEDFALRHLSPDVINLCLSIWILGMLWQEIKQLYGDGMHNYFNSLYNYLDLAVLVLYIASFTLRYFTIFKSNIGVNYFRSEDCWAEVAANNPRAHYQLYWLIADRFYWDSVDPHNVAEGLFALANVISVTRVTHVLHVYELFGPMQISLTKMITDILKFAVIFIVVFVAFMVGLHNLYWYYPKTVRGKMEFLPNNVTTEAEVAFGFPTTLNTVFWSLFGRGDPNVVELGEFNQYFIQNVGYCIFGIYNIATVIVLLNMLIAMMSRSFEKIQEEADTEWKFARSKIYIEFIQGGQSLPIPFNIIPTPKSFIKIIRALCCCCSKEAPAEEDNQNETNAGHLPDVGTNEFLRYDSKGSALGDVKVDYQVVMKRIIRRYIFDVQRQNNNSEGIFEEIKNDISSFRYEVLNTIQIKSKIGQDLEARILKMDEKMDMIFRQQNDALMSRYSGGKSYISDRKLDRNLISSDSAYWSMYASCNSIEEMEEGDEYIAGEDTGTKNDKEQQ